MTFIAYPFYLKKKKDERQIYLKKKKDERQRKAVEEQRREALQRAKNIENCKKNNHEWYSAFKTRFNDNMMYSTAFCANTYDYSQPIKLCMHCDAETTG